MSFERFTDKARNVLALAQEEARTLKQPYVGTEHLLLGLLREKEGIAAQGKNDTLLHEYLHRSKIHTGFIIHPCPPIGKFFLPATVAGAASLAAQKRGCCKAGRLATALLSAALLWYSSKSGKYQFCYTVTVVFIFLGMFSALFFISGGYHAGMTSFFVFAVLFTVFMLEGKRMLIISGFESALAAQEVNS